MAVILKLLLVSSCLLALSSAVDIDEEFKKAKLVPDIIEKSPSSLAEVVFADGSTANLGTLLKVSTVATEPKVTWPTIPDSLYTIVYIDADSPAKPPGTNVFIHWLKVNIKAADLGSGVDVYPYLFTLPLPGSPPHRYPVLVYQQDAEIEVDPLAKEKSWSFGVLLWENMTLGGTPYRTIPGEYIYQHLSAGHRLKKPPSCSDEIYGHMLKCWSFSPEGGFLFLSQSWWKASTTY